MPSTLVHVAFAGMIAAALLGAYFDWRSLLVVGGVTAIADLDTFLDLFVDYGHRAAGHTLLLPLLAGLLLWLDVRRSDSYVLNRWGHRGVRVGAVTVFAFAVSAVGLDLFTGGANAFWPIHDQFYAVDGKIELSSERGIVQTFVDLEEGMAEAGTRALGNTSEVHVSTGIVPNEGETERVFPVVRAGWHLLLVVTGTVVTVGRFFVEDE